MSITSKNQMQEKITQWNQKLDYTLQDLENREKVVNDILKDSFFEEYFTCYFKVNISKTDSLSEQDLVCSFLSRLGDYIANFTNQQNAEQKDKRHKADCSLAQLAQSTPALDDYEEVIGGKQKNHHLATASREKINDSDLKLSDIGGALTEYKHFKETIAAQRDLCTNNSIAKAKGNKGKFNFNRIIGELNSDMRTLKQMSIKYHRCNNYFNTNEPIHWDECDYTKKEQIKELIRIPDKKLTLTLGLLTYDLGKMLDSAGLTKQERRIIDFIRDNHNAKNKEITTEFHCSKQNIHKRLENAISKILDYNIKIKNH